MRTIVTAILIFLITSVATAAIFININDRRMMERLRQQQLEEQQQQQEIPQDAETEEATGEAEPAPAEEPEPTEAPDGAEIILETPRAESTVSSPLTISGRARGSWFFEATFPVVLTNWDGLIIAEGFATAQGDWMTEDYVPFTAELEFEPQEVSSRGALILKKANPSGLPENDDALEITVYLEE